MIRLNTRCGRRTPSALLLGLLLLVSCGGDGGTYPPPPIGMVLVHAGAFTMGSPTSELGLSGNETQHQVTLTKAIYVSICEVTQSEWQAVMGWNESDFPAMTKPVENVTWYDAVSYCNQRSTSDGYAPAYAITGVTMDGNHVTGGTVTWSQAANGYRLLTEAEWEHACRAASTSAFCSGGITDTGCSPSDPKLDQVGWYCGNASGTSQAVGGKTANAWGLKDMHGNASEWCWDGPASYPSGPVSDPLNPAWGSDRVVRGGCWNSDAQGCRSAARGGHYPGNGNGGIGLRVARTYP